MRRRPPTLPIVIAAALAPVAAHADGPAFDRPGIAFAPSTMPAHSFTWEQSVVDYTRDVERGITTTAWSFDTRLRYGLTDRLEMQLEVPVWASTRTQGNGARTSGDGLGDLSLAAKFDLMPGDGDWDLSLLGVVLLPTGDAAVSLDGEQYSLGATLGTSFGEDQTLALYANVDRFRGDDTGPCRRAGASTSATRSAATSRPATCRPAAAIRRTCSRVAGSCGRRATRCSSTRGCWQG